MREHRHEHATKGGRPEWLSRAHAKARHDAWFANMGQRPDRVETRDEYCDGKLAAVVAESRVDITTPTSLKDAVKEIFVKSNTAVELHDSIIVGSGLRSRTLVVVYKKPQNIRGLPVTNAEARKLRKESFTHFVITFVPEGARERTRREVRSGGGYDECGWWIGFYKPKSGHAHAHEKNGELVYAFQSELFVLQFLFENGLDALYGVQLLTSWKFLPKTDEMREEENAAAEQIQMIFGRPQRLHADRTYHRARLLEHFYHLLRESAVDAEECAAKASKAMSETVIGRAEMGRVLDGTLEARTYYLSLDKSLAYSIHNTRQGQMVVKVDLKARKLEAGIVKVGLNGLALMNLYDDFLTSNKFRQVSHSEFSAYTTGIGAVDLTRGGSTALATR